MTHLAGNVPITLMKLRSCWTNPLGNLEHGSADDGNEALGGHSIRSLQPRTITMGGTPTPLPHSLNCSLKTPLQRIPEDEAGSRVVSSAGPYRSSF
eukprot:11290444-Alexandrium_andersonii.AAC.1